MKTRGRNFVNALKSNPIFFRLAHGTFWALLGTITSRAFSLVATILIAKMLGVADFGAYGIIQSTLETFGFVAGFGLGVTSTKYLAEYRTKDKDKAGRILSLTNAFALISSGLIALAIFLFSPLIADQLLNRADLAPLLSLGAVYLFVAAQNNVQVGSLGGLEAFKETAKINLLQGVLAPVLAVPLVYYFGLQGAVISMIVIALVGYTLCRRLLNAKCRENGIRLRRFDRAAMRELPVIVHFSLPSLASGLLVLPVTWLANALLVNQPDGYSEMGLFNAANQWRQLIIFVPNVLSVVLLPIFSDVHGNEDTAEFRSVFQLNLGLTWMIALPATLAVIALRDALAFVFGAKYQGVELLIAPLMMTAFLNIINNVVGTAIAGAGRMWLGVILNSCWAAAMVASSVLLIPRFGATGLALSYMISYLLHTAWTMAYAEKKLVPGAMRKFRGLMLLTSCTMVPAYLLAATDVGNHYLDAALVLVASIPMARVLRKWYEKSSSNQHVK